MSSVSATLELDLDVNSNNEEVQISDKLIKDYQDLNDKLDQTIKKIKNKRKNPTVNLQK